MKYYNAKQDFASFNLWFLLPLLIFGNCNAQFNRPGFDRVVLWDSTRIYNEGSRPIVVSYWYPSEQAELNQSYTFQDYIFAASSRPNLISLREEDKSKMKEEIRSHLKYFAITEAEFQRILQKPAISNPAARPITGKHKLVVIMGGSSGSNSFFTLLAEHLSTEGMVVEALSSVGINDSTPCGYDTSCLKNQSADLAFAIKFLSKQSWVDSSRISLLAWSFGGLSSIMFQQQFQTTQSIVSFDSALGYEYGVKLMDELDLNGPGKLTIPILHFRSLESGKKMKQSMSFFDSILKDKTMINLHSLTHAQLTSLYGEILDYGRDIKTSDEWRFVLALTIDFLRTN